MTTVENEQELIKRCEYLQELKATIDDLCELEQRLHQERQDYDDKTGNYNEDSGSDSGEEEEQKPLTKEEIRQQQIQEQKIKKDWDEKINTITNDRKEKQKEYNNITERAIKSFRELCQNPILSSKNRLSAILSFIKYIPDEGYDMLSRWRDSICYARGKEQVKQVDMLCEICKSDIVASHERTMTAVCLYNNLFIDKCYDCFYHIAIDKNVLVNYRVEACRYLFTSGQDKFIQVSQECLLDIIEAITLLSEFRYKIIAGFITKTGLATILNTQKLKVPYNEEFVYALQTAFFYNHHNGVRERILSGQHMLQMDVINEEERRDIADILLEFARNTNYDNDTRADAADVLLRLGPTIKGPNGKESNYAAIAMQIIQELGYSELDGKSVIQRVKTVYRDSQNVHNEEIAKCVNAFLETIVKEKVKRKISIPPFQDVHTKIVELMKEEKTKGSEDDETSEQRGVAMALSRLSIDTATFTSYKVTVADILCLVWAKIQKYKKDKRNVLCQRLLEELREMNGTCSSGYASRLVNVLSEYDSSLKISFEDQILANISGRLQAAIRNCEDEELNESLAIGMMDNAPQKDRDIYLLFVNNQLKVIKTQLYKEFVTDGYISKEDFDVYFTKGFKQWTTVK